jgi:hypothetical protein
MNQKFKFVHVQGYGSVRQKHTHFDYNAQRRNDYAPGRCSQNEKASSPREGGGDACNTRVVNWPPSGPIKLGISAANADRKTGKRKVGTDAD